MMSINVVTMAVGRQWRFGVVHNSFLPPIQVHLLQVAVKALRFSFTIEKDAGNKSIKVILCVTTKVYSKLPFRCSVESLEFGGD